MSVVLQAEQEQQQRIVPSHIVIGPDGQARVAGTGYKVRIMAGWHRYHDYTPEQIQRDGHPDLTMAQVYSVLAYYYDHKVEMDADMDRDEAETERLRREAGDAPVIKRLKAAGLWPVPPSMTADQVRAGRHCARSAAARGGCPHSQEDGMRRTTDSNVLD